MAKRPRRKKKSNEAIRIGETATPERRRQLGGVLTEVIDRDATGKACIKRQKGKLECVLDYYWRTKRINDPQHQAGMKFREIYLRVNNGFAHKMLGDLVLVDDASLHVEERMLQHIVCMQQLDKIREKLSPSQEKIIVQVCCDNKFFGHDERKKTFLRGLDILARHWKLIPAETEKEDGK